MKQGRRKVKKLELKPWVIKGIKTSMKLRDKLYKEAIKEKDSQKKSRNMKLKKVFKQNFRSIKSW